MTDMDSGSSQDQTSDEVTVETTSVFRADFLNELAAVALSDPAVWPVSRRFLRPVLAITAF